MAQPAFLACDWGTTNLRAWLMAGDGRVLKSRDFPLGVSRLVPGEAARRFREEVRPGLVAEEIPAVLCGMIGSTLGWAVADYVSCPADLHDVRARLLAVEHGPWPVHIVPGLRCEGLTGAPDVMRGEETQVFGWTRLAPERRRGRWVVCHPGTHAKWVLVEEGRIVRFVTAMTGELFAVLGKHSVLKSEAAPDDERAFDEGVAAAGDGGALASRLFSARSRVVAGDARPDSTPSYLSGLLIGADVAAAPDLLGIGADAPVALIGEPALCRWYARALKGRGRMVSVHNGDEAARAGLFALQQEMAQ
jgi:2-dehydro-3-deoxygalactonokinase